MDDSLVENLEAMHWPDGLLDCRIRERVEGWRNVGGGFREWPDGRRELYDYGFAKPYTASIDAALTLVPDGFKWKLGYSKYVPCNAEVCDYRKDAALGRFDGESDANHAIALCIAALKARAAITQEQR